MPESSGVLSLEAKLIETLVNGCEGDPLERRKWNVEHTLSLPTADDFWIELVISLLTSQQRSGSNSPIEGLRKDFPLPVSQFGSLDDGQVDERLRRFRFHRRIAAQLVANYHWLFRAGSGWDRLQKLMGDLLQQRNSPPVSTHSELERKVADELRANLKGVGSKQARNLLQSLGLTRYEIPLDSRVVLWLRDRLGWNIHTEALSRTDYYEDLLDRVQASGAAAGVLPTLFDAAAFEEMEKRMREKKSPTTCTGYVNRNGQVVVRNTRAAGTDKNQFVYQLACSHCGHVYGANGSDIHLRLCPGCQGGATGLHIE